MKEILIQMAEIIHLSPARLAQIYFKVQVNVSENYLKLTTASSEFLESKPSRNALAESILHAGMAIGCLEEWLKDQGIKYLIDEKIENEHIVVKVTLK